MERSAYADTIEVGYDADVGYAGVIDVDPVRQAIDEESRVSVIELAVP